MLATALAVPLGLFAARTSAAARSIGWISPDAPDAAAPFLDAFKAGLASSAPPGSEPINTIERYAVGGPDAAATCVAELQQLGVQLIVAQGAATLAVVRANPTVPVVYGYSGDPVVARIAQSLARPGGNATGMTFMAIELNLKRIDMVRAIVPGCRKVALISNARHAGEEQEIAVCQRTVTPLGIELAVHRVQDAAELKPALAQALDGGSGTEAVVALPSALMVRHGPMLAAGCLERRVPLISGWSQIARAGALLTYGPNLREAWGRVAFYAVRVLGGAAAGSLPIEQPTIFELAINMKTARALGLNLPTALLVQADEMIE